MPIRVNPLPKLFDRVLTGAAAGGVTQINTDSGNITPTAGVVSIVADDTTENDNDGITTSGTGSTETIFLTNRLQGSGSTTGAVTADLITFSLGALAASYRFRFDIAGRDTATGDGVGYTLFSSARTTGAAATIIQTPMIDTDEDVSLTGASIDHIASGNNVILRVTGVAGQTINYQAVGYYVVV